MAPGHTWVRAGGPGRDRKAQKHRKQNMMTIQKILLVAKHSVALAIARSVGGA